MTWIGLRDAEAALWHPRGLGRPGEASGDAVLARGAVMIEFQVPAGQRRRNILRFASRDPWDALLSVAVESDGAIVVMQGWRGESRTWHLAVPKLIEGETIVVTLQWDAPARAGVVSAWLADRPELRVAAASPPLPLHRADAERLFSDPGACLVTPELIFVAMSDRPVPLGPTNGVNLGAQVRVPGGTLDASALHAGDAVQLADGGLARIAWAGTVRVPARGRFRPFLLQAPYNGLEGDLAASADLRLWLDGSDIEYLFGAETVAAAVRQIADQKRVIAAPAPLTLCYRQFLLDRAGAMSICGATVGTYDLTAFRAEPKLVTLTAPGKAALPVLRGGWSPGPRHLQDFEASSLRRMRAA